MTRREGALNCFRRGIVERAALPPILFLASFEITPGVVYSTRANRLGERGKRGKSLLMSESRLKVPLSLFSSFRPTDWREQVYTSRPPFVVQTTSGHVYVFPRDSDVESILDRISSQLGLKKSRQGRSGYLVSRGNGVNGLREFDWYVRRSWRNKELSILWALAFLGEKGGWAQTRLRLQHVAEAAGLTTNECSEGVQALFHSAGNGGSDRILAELASDMRLVAQTIEKKVSELPIWTEENVMSALCTVPGGSVAQLYEALLSQGLTMGAVYKVSERLKTQGYVYTQTHYRVNERGPMREQLAADCRNCFFGYSTPDGCLADTLRQNEDNFERDYGRRPAREEREVLYSSIKSVPFAPQTNRRVLGSLRLMREIGSITKDAHVSTVLKHIHQSYGVDLPIKLPEE